VPERVVDLLEIVEVDEQRGDAVARAAGARERVEASVDIID